MRWNWDKNMKCEQEKEALEKVRGEGRIQKEGRRWNEFWEYINFE